MITFKNTYYYLYMCLSAEKHARVITKSFKYKSMLHYDKFCGESTLKYNFKKKTKCKIRDF